MDADRAPIRFSDEIRTDVAIGDTQVALGILEERLDQLHRLYERAARDELAAGKTLAAGGTKSTTTLVLHQATLISARMIGLAEALIELVNNHFVYAAAPVSRALHEQCCVPCYMADQIVPRLRKQRTNDVLRLLFRIGLGAGPDAGYGDIRPISVTALNVEGTNAQASGTTIKKQAYGPLSDLTHPNWRAMDPFPRRPGEPHILRPALNDELLGAIIGPPALLLIAAGSALTDTVVAAIDHPLEYVGHPDWQDGDLYTERPRQPH
jgi:hypothetical protein